MKLLVIAVLAVLSVNMVVSKRWLKKRGDLCRSGDGSSYHGSVDKSARGRRCLNWNRVKLHSNGLIYHNYCRNPDKSLMPWCYVRRGKKILREFCDIPRCSKPTAKPSLPVDSELTCGERSERRMHKIVGGSYKPIESNPWLATIFHKSRRYLCGGSLIAPCWVLTAAHCFSESDIQLKHLSVFLGKSSLNDTDADREQKFTVEELILHHSFNETTYNNDIALLKIKSPTGQCAVKSSSVRTVCLPPSHTQLPAGFSCTIAGFGKETQTSWHYSHRLKQAEVNLISDAVCKSELQYGNLIEVNMFCAGSPDWSTDACEGDSGGPLVCEVSGRRFLFGVVSWGDGCAKVNKPGVYTQVTNYNKWIANKTGLPEYTKGVLYPEK
ncbi:tissue-type plasminogen activator-like [Gouania willdenowi]|uniref:trypsin n=1 Tax=Gouania willdenowi TaxID=441366 RepID=A0A8C5H5W0_GOUWI|nr:urokinase-type plasminogen activator [Gouania willdenowi]